MTAWFTHICTWLWIDSGRNFWVKVVPWLAGALTFVAVLEKADLTTSIVRSAAAIVSTWVVVRFYRRLFGLP